jgi:hypothetical protein
MGMIQRSGGRLLYETDGLAEALELTTERVMHSNAERMMGGAQRPQAGGPEEPDDETVPPWAESKARREFYGAEKAQMELQALAGTLVLREKVHSWLFERERVIRNRLQAFPARISADLAAESRQVECEILLDKAIYDCLVDLAKAFPDVL